jgi:protein SCO1/2
VPTPFIQTVRPRLAVAALIATAVLAGAAGCGSSTATAGSGAAAATVDSSPASLFDGTLLGNALAKPAITLTDTSGQAYNLVQRTAGQLTLVYFGYTHCPDVCPTTMATLAAALRPLAPAQQAKITVVFITTDPNRDTPAVLRAWLGQFSSGFVGLTGPFTTIQKAAASLGIAIQEPVAVPGGYTVTHGAEVLAFNTDGKARVVYTAGETVQQFQHDIPLLLAGRDRSSP